MGTTDNRIWFSTTCSQNGLPLNEGQLDQFEQLARRLLEWNQKINLISRKDEENFWTNHLLHSLSILFKIRIRTGTKILDLGTGGGLPGLPLKIARPDLAFTLLDSTQKKINVVNDLIQDLELTGCKAVWGRAEDVGRSKEHHRQYDVVVARAVAPMKDLVQWAAPFLRTDQVSESSITDSTQQAGDPRVCLTTPSLVALKGGDLEGELGQIRKLPSLGSITTLALTLRGTSQLEEGEKKVVVVEMASHIKQKATHA